MINIVIAEDQPIFIDGLKTALNGAEGINIVAVAVNGKQALELLGSNKVDVILLDINMPVMDGLHAAEVIKQKLSHVKIIMLTQYDERRFVRKCREIGVEGYLLKDCGGPILIDAIRTVYEGGSIYRNKGCGNNNFPVPELINCVLTEKEKIVLKMIVNECCNKDIANEINIEVNTVKTYKERLKEKTGTTNMIGLVKWAIENNMV